MKEVKNVTVREVSKDDDIRKVAEMAKPIWQDTYTGIISEAQIDYMVEKFQSYEAINKQIKEEGYRYYILSEDGTDAGYCGVQVKEDNTMYLSKMYIMKEFRGHGLFKEMTAMLKGTCRKEGIGKIWLTVNKNNDRAIAAYTATGYSNARVLVSDIGNGFVMDDYVFELDI